MGGAASLTQIPQEILRESETSHSYGSLTKNQLTLSREVLSSIYPQHKEPYGAQKDTKRIVHEIPASVITFLEKIGISSSENDDPHSIDRNVSAQSIKTRKLVSHIFECLGALQHLVKANQSQEDFSMDEYEETQSVIEVNKDSIGKLLHEMITIYTICGDTIRVLLQSTPESAKVEDNFGRLPLHVAVDRDRPWMFAIEQLLQAYPEALNRRDSGGRLPLHIAVDRQEPCVDLVKMLLHRYPLAASARRGVGRLPLHYAVFAEKPSLEVLRCLLTAYPDGASTADVYGRLPIHYAVDKAWQDFAVIKYLLEIYPEGASVRDTHNRLPLTICIDRENVNFAVIKLLCNAYPAGLTERGPNDKLPLHVLIEAPNEHSEAIYFMARQFPETVLTTCSLLASKQQDTAMSIALSRNNSLTMRYLLLLHPQYDPVLLRQLNWDARRVAFLLVKASTRRASAVERMAQLTLSRSTPKNSFSNQQYTQRGDHSPQPPRLSNTARKYSSSTVSVSELNLQMMSQYGQGSGLHSEMLSARGSGRFDPFSTHRPSGMSSNSNESPCNSPKGTFTSSPLKRHTQPVNFYMRFHSTNQELFKLAVMFL